MFFLPRIARTIRPGPPDTCELGQRFLFSTRVTHAYTRFIEPVGICVRNRVWLHLKLGPSPEVLQHRSPSVNDSTRNRKPRCGRPAATTALRTLTDCVRARVFVTMTGVYRFRALFRIFCYRDYNNTAAQFGRRLFSQTSAVMICAQCCAVAMNDKIMMRSPELLESKEEHFYLSTVLLWFNGPWAD